MVLFSAIALATVLPAAVALAIVLPYDMAFVNDIAIAMIVAMAIDIALAGATTVIIVHPYRVNQEEEKFKYNFCSRFEYGYCFVHSSCYGSG